MLVLGFASMALAFWQTSGKLHFKLTPVFTIAVIYIWHTLMYWHCCLIYCTCFTASTFEKCCECTSLGFILYLVLASVASALAVFGFGTGSVALSLTVQALLISPVIIKYYLLCSTVQAILSYDYKIEINAYLLTYLLNQAMFNMNQHYSNNCNIFGCRIWQLVM